MTTVYKFQVGQRVSHMAECIDGVIEKQVTSKQLFGSDMEEYGYDGNEPFYIIRWDDDITTNENERNIIELTT